MAKKEPVSVSFNVKTNGFPVNHYFNCFRIEATGEGVLVHLAYQSTNSYFMGLFSFFIPEEDIIRQKENLLQYIDALDFEGDDVAESVLPINDRPVHTVRFLHAGRTGKHAELLLYNIPVYQQVVAPGQNEGSTINADPLAALSSPLEIHSSLLKNIFVR